jgi:hypothetical protein
MECAQVAEDEQPVARHVQQVGQHDSHDDGRDHRHRLQALSQHGEGEHRQNTGNHDATEERGVGNDLFRLLQKAQDGRREQQEAGNDC